MKITESVLSQSSSGYHLSNLFKTFIYHYDNDYNHNEKKHWHLQQKKQFQGFDKQAYLKWAKAVIAAILAQSAMLPPLSNTCTSTLIDQTYVT